MVPRAAAESGEAPTFQAPSPVCRAQGSLPAALSFLSSQFSLLLSEVPGQPPVTPEA